MKKYFYVYSLSTVAAIILGIFSAFADGQFNAYWSSQPQYFESLGLLVVGLVGNAAGVWGLCTLVASYISAVKSERFIHGVIVGLVFLLCAVLSYYMTIHLASLRPGAVLLPTMMKWLAVAAVVGIISGIAGAWLANSKKAWQKVLGLVLILSYVGLDCALVIRNAGLNPAMLTIVFLYVAAAGLLMWFMTKSFRLIAFASLIGGLMLGALVLLFPTINGALIQIQHGVPPSDEINVIQVN